MERYGDGTRTAGPCVERSGSPRDREICHEGCHLYEWDSLQYLERVIPWRRGDVKSRGPIENTPTPVSVSHIDDEEFLSFMVLPSPFLRRRGGGRRRTGNTGPRRGPE